MLRGAMSQRLRPQVILLGLVSLLNDSASEMIYPLLPVFLTTTLGATPLIVGIIEGSADALASIDQVDFIEDRNSIRMETRRLLEELLKAEEKIDAAARQKIESQRRTIVEGTQEWDILYRKYYNEEVKKLGI